MNLTETTKAQERQSFETVSKMVFSVHMFFSVR